MGSVPVLWNSTKMFESCESLQKHDICAAAAVEQMRAEQSPVLSEINVALGKPCQQWSDHRFFDGHTVLITADDVSWEGAGCSKAVDGIADPRWGEACRFFIIMLSSMAHEKQISRRPKHF